jgi:heme/copper-type cytochrome/quinol oxidase subunit 2
MVKPGHEKADGSVTPETTEYSFTPTKKGVFRWHCAIPCDKGGHFWAMSKGYDGPDRDGYMAGYFVVM